MMVENKKPRVLFLCVGNSARSQMAEGWARALRPDLEVESAGAIPVGVHYQVVQVMAEAGVDISGQRSKHIDEFRGQAFDLIVTLCADDYCPVWTGPGRQFHHGFDDPVTLAFQDAAGNDPLRHFRRVRDQIRDFVLTLSAEPEDRMPFVLNIGGKP